METLNEWLTSATEMLGKLNGAPGYVLVFISCIAIGYVLRNVKQFPNGGIPVAIALWGGLFTVMVAEDAPIPLRIWIFRNAAFGVSIGVAAWLFHKFILSRAEGAWFKKQAMEKMEVQTEILEKKIEDAKP